MGDHPPERIHARGVPIRIVPSKEPQVRSEPPLDGPEPRLARLGDGSAHALGTTTEGTLRLHGPSGGSPSWYGPAATTISRPARADARRHQMRPRPLGPRPGELMFRSQIKVQSPSAAVSAATRTHPPETAVCAWSGVNVTRRQVPGAR